MKLIIKKYLPTFLILTLATISHADDSMPGFIEKGKEYIGAIAMTGEIAFKVLEIDDNQNWIFVETQEPVFGDENSAWLNMQHLIALRQVNQ